MVFTRETTSEEQALTHFLYSEKNLSLPKIAIKTGRSVAIVMGVIRNANRGVSRHTKVD